ncbi:MAG TPA: M14 family zinc carboxypeptidase [Bryobacteraceae bacterium]|nr:M14 family zinc carboxypeptidase [Bryobacteraceae bacterium]
MTRAARLVLLAQILLAAFAAQGQDQAYSARIKEYTTEPFFLTELVDHLPASDRVPTPEKALGYVIGTPNKLTYTADIHRYMRELEKASPRVKVFSMGRSEEGRETILVAVSDESNMKRLDRIREITARLADPRKTPDSEARRLLEEALPIYWIGGSIHSAECGSPEMLMELAYRLAVGESPFLQAIRKNAVVMITPVQEVDGHDRYVDVYNYKKANPGKAAPPLVYWGKYVAHDNNRDGMALSLALSKMMVKTFLEWHPQVYHDLHESLPFLYTSTGMGPYNAWLDPIVISEWQKLANHEVEEMAKRGVPGVWSHGFYDGWAANYMMYVAQGRNATGRFYETFGGTGADTIEREVGESYTSRAWYRPNPPLPKVKWSIRNNINLQQSAVLLALNYFAGNRRVFLENFYLKSKRSVAKAVNEGPAAWVIPANDPRPTECADLVNLLRLHGVEVHRAGAEIEIARQEGKEAKKETYPRGSYVIRMDQPYSRQADMLLDTQYYNPRDTRPYDDTGWSLGPLRHVKTVRVTDLSILKAPMTLLTAAAKVEGRVIGEGTAAFLIPHTAENALAVLRFRLKDVEMLAAEEAFQAASREFGAGTFVIKSAGNPAGLRARIEEAARELGLTVYASEAVPSAAAHKLAVPRVALVHTWQSTQAEGWFRLALDSLGFPYEYISDQTLARTPDLRAKYDVILFGPVSGSAQRIVGGVPMHGEPVPWKKTDLTPNIGTSPDQTDDVRGGMGLEGLMNIRRFVNEGGLFITIAGNASIPIDFGLVEGVSVVQTRELQVRGSVVNAVVADKASPIAYGYPERFAVYFSQAPVFRVNTTGRSGGGVDEEDAAARASGRGTATDPDVPQGRPFTPPPAKPELKPGEERPLTEEERESQRLYLFPEALRPRVVLRFADEKELLVSGMLAGGRELAGRPAVVAVPRGKGHVVLFANNPMWRMQTQGSHFLLFNAMLNFDNLGAGRQKAAGAESGPPGAQ